MVGVWAIDRRDVEMVRVRSIRMDNGELYLWRKKICHDCDAKVGELQDRKSVV